MLPAETGGLGHRSACCVRAGEKFCVVEKYRFLLVCGKKKTGEKNTMSIPQVQQEDAREIERGPGWGSVFRRRDSRPFFLWLLLNVPFFFFRLVLLMINDLYTTLLE